MFYLSRMNGNYDISYQKELYLYEVITVLKVDDNSHIQILISSGKWEGASCHAVAHPGVLCQGFAQVSSGFWMLSPEQQHTRVTTMGQR